MDIPTNEQKDAVWRAYHDGRPTRVPVTYGVNPRAVLLDETWNSKGISFEEYFTDPAATIEVQLRFMEFKAEYLHLYCDYPLGLPEQWEFYVDNQNFYDSAYFGAPIEFRDGQVADVSPVLAGAGKERIFAIDVDRPLDNPFVVSYLDRHARLAAAVERLSARSIAFTVRPPAMGFDGPFTIAINLRGPELLTDIYEDPEYVRRLTDFIQRGAILRNRALAGLGGKDAFEGARGGGADDSIQLISTDMYRRLVLPLHRAWYALWSVEGPHSIHLCGDATRHFPTIRDELNVRSFDTGFPVDHGWLREALGDDVEIQGGPEAHVLLGPTAEQVYDRTRDILASGVMRGGRFILREANNLPPGVPAENLAAMYRAGLEHGTYTGA
ncbi:MAG: uroporphyrinogen decarboxylase family protein [Planctomycetota bacterium]|jgi:uroporphyrinogen-III decarboxylase